MISTKNQVIIFEEKEGTIFFNIYNFYSVFTSKEMGWVIKEYILKNFDYKSYLENILTPTKSKTGINLMQSYDKK